jgi:hypothetical protein
MKGKKGRSTLHASGFSACIVQKHKYLNKINSSEKGELYMLIVFTALVENPVALVENHHLCERNTEGEKVLPDGLIWRRLLLLLCYSLKMVAEIDSLSTRRASSTSLFGLRLQIPPLPYFLSSLLQSREHPRHASEQRLESVDSNVDIDELLDEDQEDEEYDYDQLPPFKPLSKSQVAKLSKEQQKLYFDEYDYRTKLL